MALQGKTTVIKRGNTADNNLLLGAKGEIVVNETTKSLRVHTGTRGGTELLRSDMANLDTGVSSVLDFNGARLRDIGSPVASTDAATKAYVDAHGGGGGGSSTLEGLSDVALGGTITSGELLKYDGSAWINSTISLSDLSDSSTVATKTYVDTEIGALGTASTYDVGTGPNNVVKLDGSSKLPAVDGSLLTGVNISGGLLASNNLSDLSNSATARSNLGLGTVATLNSNAVLQVSNNLSELTSTAGTARSNLGLGNVATLSTGMSSGEVPLAQNVAILTDGKISGLVLPTDVITTTGLSALKDVANGIAGLDSDGHLASSVLPDLAITHVSSGLLADRPAATVDNTGDVYIATDTSQTFISTGSDWSEILNLNSASIADLIGDMDNVKLSFGAIVNSESAAWVGFDSTNYLDSGTDLKTSLEALDTQIKTNSDALLNVLTTSSTLNDLSGVIISGSPNGKFLKNNGTDWVDNVIDHSDVNGLGSSALKTAGTSANNVLLLDNNGEFSGSLITDSSVTSSKISGNIPVAIVSGLGTSATLDVGTTANKVVQLNGSAQLPAVSGVNLTGITASQVSGISGTYAPLASPALTGTPTAPTASPGTSTTQIATTAFVQSEAYTDTDAVAAVNYALANGYNITISGTVNITGTATASTQSANDSSTKVATTEYVQNELSAMLLNDLSDVVITGTPSNNQVLKYDTGTSKWVNGTSSASVSNLDDIGDVATGGAVDGDILKYDGSHWVNKKPSIALNYVALTDASITLASGKYYVYSSATDTTQKNILTLPSNGIISNTGGETIYVSIVDSIADTNNNYVLKAGTNTRIIYEDVILAESAELALSSTGLYTITHVIRDGEKRYYVTLNKSVSSNSSYTDSDAVDALVNALDDTNITYTLSSGQILSSINTSSISNNKLIHSSITIGSSSISLGGTLALSGLSFDGTTLSVNSISLDGLSDVALGTLSTGQVLKYNGTSWVNGTDNTGGGVSLSGNNTFTGENSFTGTLILGSLATATTPPENDSTTAVATTEYVQTELSAITLNDLSDVLVGGLLSNEILKWNGSNWINGSIASTDLSDSDNIPRLDASNIFTNDLTIQNNVSTPIATSDVYLYVRYGNYSLSDGEIFYVFSTTDGGATRKVLPFTLMQDTGVNYLQEDNIFAYKRYKSAFATTYNNASNKPNASIGFEAGTTYYIEGSTTWDDTGTPNDIEVFFSTSSTATPTWTKLFPDDGGNATPPLVKTYEIVLESALTPVSLNSIVSITNRPNSIITSSDMVVLDKDTGNIVSNGYIQLKQQNSHPSTVADHAHVYAKVDVSDTEIYVQDSAGNNTRLSSHNEEGEWEYYSYNKRTGKSIRINMEKMIRTLEAITGEKFIIEE